MNALPGRCGERCRAFFSHGMSDSKVIYVKNMVCDRCIHTVKQVFESFDLPVRSVSLGHVELDGTTVPAVDWSQLEEALKEKGFELLRDPEAVLVERIKTALISKFQKLPLDGRVRLSEYLPAVLHHDYAYLSKLFSRHTGMTIERYFILLRIEKAKELISYDQHSFSEIAWMLGYSSPQHLSAQFRQVVGMSMSAYARLPEKPRTGLDKLL